MLPKAQRLVVAEFPTRGFLRVESDCLIMKVAKNNLAGNRFGVIIGKTISKLASRRHFLKRQILSRCLMWPEEGRDFLIIGKATLGQISQINLQKDLKKIHQLTLS